MAFLGYVALVGLIWWIVLWSISLLGWRIARTRYHTPQDGSPSSASYGRDASASSNDANVPGVSILRPLRGLDCNMYENLQSTFVQLYPREKLQIIFSVAEEDDQAIKIVHELMDRYANVDARLIIGEERVGINPKINNLVRPYREAKFDMLWILDSNVQVNPGALARAVAYFTPSSSSSRPIGLVHHVPYPVYPDTDLGSRVEQAFLSTTHAKMYMAINWTSIDSCVCGKSNLFRKSDLERATRRHEEKRKSQKSTVISGAMASLEEKDRFGIAAFSEYLGEDNMIGWFIWHELGMRHAIASPDVAANAVGNMTFEKYFWRRVRWIRVRKYMVMASTLVEPLTESILCGLVGSSSLRFFLHTPIWLTFLLHMILWYSIDVSIFRSLHLGSPAQPLHNSWHDGPGLSGPALRPAFLRAWLTREVCAFPIWLFAMLGNKVTWREDGKIYRVRSDGKVEEVDRDEGKDWIDRLGEGIFRRWKGRGGKTYDRVRLNEEEQT